MIIEENGLRQICLTDHFWDDMVPGASDWYRPQNYERISAAKPLPQSEKVRFLFGAETDMNRFMTVGIAPENYKLFDFVIIPTTHLHMGGFTFDEKDSGTVNRARLWSARLQTVLNMNIPFHKVGIAHLTCGLITPTREQYLDVLNMIPNVEMKNLFQRAASLDVGIELNASDMSFADSEADIVLRPYRIAKQCGCKFYCGSDAHHPHTFDNVKATFERAIDMLGLKEEDKFQLR